MTKLLEQYAERFPNLVFVDCESSRAHQSPVLGPCTEFGAVLLNGESFHGQLRGQSDESVAQVWKNFGYWLESRVPGPRSAVTDNPAYDWQWINAGLWLHYGENPLGHSARRISDWYAGLTGDWRNTQWWKRLRVTPHDHSPVNDARGNMEAWVRIMEGER